MEASKKTLHVILDFDGEEDYERGCVYVPERVYSDKVDSSSRRIYEEFFGRKGDFRVFPLETLQGPGDLACTVMEKFNIKSAGSGGVGGTIAYFNATKEKARAIVRDLRINPEKYVGSSKDISAYF